MTQLEKNIYQVIASGHGVKGAEIADKLGLEKKIVNSTLYKSTALKALVFQDDSYKWRLKSVLTQETQSVNINTPKPDEDLRNICNYYLNMKLMPDE